MTHTLSFGRKVIYLFGNNPYFCVITSYYQTTYHERITHHYPRKGLD